MLTYALYDLAHLAAEELTNTISKAQARVSLFRCRLLLYFEVVLMFGLSFGVCRPERGLFGFARIDIPTRALAGGMSLNTQQQVPFAMYVLFFWSSLPRLIVSSCFSACGLVSRCLR